MSLVVFESTVRDFCNQVGKYLSAFDNPLAMLGYSLAYGIAANVVINLAKLVQTLKMIQDNRSPIIQSIKQQSSVTRQLRDALQMQELDAAVIYLLCRTL